MHTLVVPVKSFAAAKQRLGSMLGCAQRQDLAESSFAALLHANRTTDIVAVTDDASIQTWIAEHACTDAHVEVLIQTTPGLNGAITDAFTMLRERAVHRVAIAHGDLASPVDLSWVSATPWTDDIVIVPDRHGDGTNVLCLPTEIDFRFAYGPSSFANHWRAACATKRTVHVIADSEASHDLDTPADLRQVRARYRAWQ